MARKVEVAVDKYGRIRADFAGFPGSDCYTEAENLEKALARLGLVLKLEVRQGKDPARVMAELGKEEETGAGQGLRTR